MPFLVRWPAKIKPKTVISHFITNVDFMPTLLRLMGVEPSGREQGSDASAPLRGEKTPWRDEAQIHHASRRGAGIFTPEYELVLKKNGLPMLFHRLRDPEQKNNRAEDPAYKNVYDDLALMIIRHHKQLNTSCAGWLDDAAKRGPRSAA